MNHKVIVFGLDCAPPQQVFHDWRTHLPNLSNLMDGGMYGPLRSSDPPITIPAWSSMLSGKTPAELGFYGFKTRRAGAYFEHELVTSQAVRHKRIWEYLADHGKKSILMGIPQTFPAFPVNGHLISCFLTPSIDSNCFYPPELKEEVRTVCPDYTFDVPHFRNTPKAEIFDALLKSMRGHFKVFGHLLEKKEWDFAMMVEIGTDRLQHCFWNDWDPKHPLHDPASPFKEAMLQYYKEVDGFIGEIVRSHANAAVFVVSDHGAKSMLGAISINEWLIEKGYLKLKQYPEKLTAVSKCDIDWPNTKVWAEGGYYGRIYFNVQGRETQGVLALSEYFIWLEKMRREIEGIPGINGVKLNTKTFTPQELYGFQTDGAPDLFIYFDDLNYRCLGSVGTRKVAHIENDIGPDGANHDYDGIFIARIPGASAAKAPQGMRLIDVARTLLGCYGVQPSSSVLGGKNLLEAFSGFKIPS